MAGRTPTGGAAFMLDEASVTISRLIELHRAELEVEHRRPRDEARAEFAARIGAGLDGREAAEALEGYILGLERRVAPIAARRGPAVLVLPLTPRPARAVARRTGLDGSAVPHGVHPRATQARQR